MSERKPRERMVYQAAQSMREQGVSGTSLRDVVTRAGAPRGSLQHYFPRGKDQLVAEALVWSAGFAAAAVDGYVRTAAEPTPGTLFASMARQWQDELRNRGFSRGCPLVAAAAEVAGPDAALRATVGDAFDTWLRPVRRALRGMGVPAARARSLAVLMVSSLEGAIVLSRAQADVAPLTTVVRELAPLLDSAVLDGAVLR